MSSVSATAPGSAEALPRHNLTLTWAAQGWGQDPALETDSLHLRPWHLSGSPAPDTQLMFLPWTFGYIRAQAVSSVALNMRAFHEAPTVRQALMFSGGNDS